MMTPREAELTRRLEEAQAVVARLERENQLLRQKVDALVRRCFGASSEKLDPKQIQLALGLPQSEVTQNPAVETTPPPAAPLTKKAPRTAKAPRLPDHLPVIEEVIDPEPALPMNWKSPRSPR